MDNETCAAIQSYQLYVQSTNPYTRIALESRKRYERKRDLARLEIYIPDMELDDFSNAGRVVIVKKLHRILQRMMPHQKSGNWIFDINRFIGIITAFTAETEQLIGRCGLESLFTHHHP